MQPSQTQATPDPARLRRNTLLLCGFHALQMGLFPIAVITLFLRDLGLPMFQVFVLQAIFGGMVALLEFPSGYVADRIGYRRTLIAAAAFQAAGWAVYGMAVGFFSVLAAELLLAVSVSMISGADTALLYESLLAQREEHSFGRWYSRYRSLANAAEGSAALLGSFLFVHWPRLPFALQLGSSVLAFALSLWLVEPARAAGAALGTLERVGALLRYAVFEVPRLRALVALATVLGLSSYVMVWILPVYVEDGGLSAAWLGPIWAAASYSVALSSLAAPWLGRRLGLHAALAQCLLLLAVAYAGLGLTHAWYGFGFYFLLCSMRGLQHPLLHHEEQRLIPSSDRAGLLSLNSLVFRGAFALFGPLIGYALDSTEHHVVLLWLGVLFSALALATWLWFVRTAKTGRIKALSAA